MTFSSPGSLRSRPRGRPSVRDPHRPTLRRWLVDLRRAVRRRRRILAVLATLAAVLTGLTALAPPRPETITVLTAARTLPSGHTVTADDLASAPLPPAAVPDGAVRDPTSLVGQTLAGPVPAGQVLTPSALLRHRTDGVATVVAPLPLADERVAGLLEPGDRIDVLSADGQTGRTTVVARAVTVVTGAITDESAVGTGGLVLVEVSPPTATALAAAAATGVLSVVWH